MYGFQNMRGGGIEKCEYPEYIRWNRRRLIRRKTEIVGITRIRNESLLIEDTLNHMSRIVDGIIVLDDFSTDDTVAKVKKNKNVLEIMMHTKWNDNRILEETEHRKILYEEAKKYQPEWVFYFDADERFEIEKEAILGLPESADGIRIRLYDAYMTSNDDASYTPGSELWNFRKYFGPEYRDILMIFRNKQYIRFEGLDAREPAGCRNEMQLFFCQHYGKAVSYEQWDETCTYYAENFPEPYKSKWEMRKGKALHRQSDFGNRLYLWDEVKKHGMKMP